MDKLLAIRVFTRVVECGSFAKAAETLLLARSSVTNLIKQLEEQIGVRLLHRTTRSLSLTPQGDAYYAHCVKLLEEMQTAETQLREQRSAPTGRIRADMPGVLANTLVLPHLTEFSKRYPLLELVLSISDKPIDLISEGIDCTIRSGRLHDSSLVARPLGSLQWIVCASADYLRSNPAPQSIEDLNRHSIVNYLTATSGRPREWSFKVSGENVRREFKSRFAINETHSYIQAAVQGLGLIQITDFVVRQWLETGELVEVLHDIRSDPLPISLLYPSGRNLPNAVRVFSDWVSEVAARHLIS